MSGLMKWTALCLIAAWATGLFTLAMEVVRYGQGLPAAWGASVLHAAGFGALAGFLAWSVVEGA